MPVGIPHFNGFLILLMVYWNSSVPAGTPRFVCFSYILDLTTLPCTVPVDTGHVKARFVTSRYVTLHCVTLRLVHIHRFFFLSNFYLGPNFVFGPKFFNSFVFYPDFSAQILIFFVLYPDFCAKYLGSYQL